MSVALILGCAENVWSDAAEAQALCRPDAIIAVKNMMQLYPHRIDYAVTLHPDRTAGYLKQRKAAGYPMGFEVWAHKNMGGCHTHRTTPDWQGSSGLLAVKVAFEEGFQGVILAGVPMDGKAGHVVRKREWFSARLFKKGWEKHLPEIKDRVRSMSGWTRDLLGAPDEVWLRSVGATVLVHEVDRLPQIGAVARGAAVAV